MRSRSSTRSVSADLVGNLPKVGRGRLDPLGSEQLDQPLTWVLVIGVIVIGQHRRQDVVLDRLDRLMCPNVTRRADGAEAPLVVRDDAFAVVERRELADGETGLPLVAPEGAQVTQGSKSDDRHVRIIANPSLARGWRFRVVPLRESCGYCAGVWASIGRRYVVPPERSHRPRKRCRRRDLGHLRVTHRTHRDRHPTQLHDQPRIVHIDFVPAAEPWPVI